MDLGFVYLPMDYEMSKEKEVRGREENINSLELFQRLMTRSKKLRFRLKDSSNDGQKGHQAEEDSARNT